VCPSCLVNVAVVGRGQCQCFVSSVLSCHEKRALSSNVLWWWWLWCWLSSHSPPPQHTHPPCLLCWLHDHSTGRLLGALKTFLFQTSSEFSKMADMLRRPCGSDDGESNSAAMLTATEARRTMLRCLSRALLLAVCLHVPSPRALTHVYRSVLYSFGLRHSAHPGGVFCSSRGETVSSKTRGFHRMTSRRTTIITKNTLTDALVAQ